jgi:electron transfer flavoprotein alpha subunit
MDFAPAVAFRTGAACITGVEHIFHDTDRLFFGRSMFGGKLFAKVLSKTEMTVLTLQPGSFKPRPAEGSLREKVEVRAINLQPRQSQSAGIKSVQIPLDSLAKAKIIITAGRGIGKKENLEHIYRLARLFPKSAVGGSRPVCDLGWLEYGQQVGVTGATVTPELYMACGVSGAMQHISGMRGAGFVVAINTDPHAAFFNFADVCITEDLATFIPALLEAYENRRQTSD